MSTFFVFIFSLTFGLLAIMQSGQSSFFVRPSHASHPTIKKSLEMATSASILKKKQGPEVLSGFCLRVPVLFYHHVQPYKAARDKGQTALSVDSQAFDGQMNYLTSHGYTTLTAEQLVDALRKHVQLPSKSIVITLDDGYKDAYEYAYPIFQKYHIMVNLAIPTGLLNGSDYMSWAQLEEMTRSGLVSVLNHTWSHASLPNISTDKASYEIDTARTQLEQHTGQKNSTFVYPYGSFNNAIIGMLQKKGFLGGFSTNPGFMQCDSFIMTLHRNRIGNSSLSYYGL